MLNHLRHTLPLFLLTTPTVIGQGAATARPAEQRVTLYAELEFARIGGYVDVREGPEGGPGSGTRMELPDLGMEDAQILAVGAIIPTGEWSDLRVRSRYWIMSGTATFQQDVGFNGFVYAAGQPLDSEVLMIDVLVDWRPRIWSFGDGGALRLLAGLDFTYLDFKIEGTPTPTSPAGDTSEGFYAQELPLPSLGMRVDYPLGPDVNLHAEAFGFRAIGWDSLRSEGGEVTLSRDNFEATVGASIRLGPAWHLDAGVRFGYLFIDEQSREDGNVILLQETGAFVGIRVQL